MKGTAYLLQATLISLWWIGLSINQDFYDAFQFPSISKTAFYSFLIPDLVVIALLSLIRAYTSKKEIEYIVLGGFAFATLFCINASLLTKGGYLATSAMVLGLCYNIFLVYQDRMFRESESKNVLVNGLKTLVQIICVWAITLIIFPWLILDSFGITPNIGNEFKHFGIVLFTLFSGLGLYSALVMVREGNGTPLPLDQTSKLVINGPYKFVRNPMAIAGMGQGMAVGILLCSIHIFIYTIIGGILWQLVVRPIEEKDMLSRFGNDYEEYKRTVSCWIPKFKG